MTIRLFNTMTRKIEEFKPLTPGKMGFYSCGPTVYHYAHIGNLRTMIHNDILKRMFTENGYAVHHVMNITDVGHLTSDDADSGDDKMERGAARDHKSVWEIAKFYTDEFLRDFDDLNNIRPTDMPRATDYIAEQIDLVKKLQDLGYTYEIPGDGIYYDTSKFAAYGALTGGSVAGNRAGARVEYNNEKHNPTDFALWKFSPTDQKRQMEWDSPWGIGFPGWHAECSAMSMKLLGNHFDIHTGGEDLSRIHHTNEIAQSEPITGAPWVSYWVHFSFLVDKSGEKMSKSNGEFLGLDVIRKRGYDTMVYRYLILLGHYQTQLAFSWDAMDAAANGYKNIVRRVAEILADTDPGALVESTFNEWHDRILNSVSDNMKTAESLVQVQELLRDKSINASTKIALFEFIDRLLGLQFIDRAKKLNDTESETAPAEIIALADARAAAKSARDWARADELRAQIDAAGWSVVDTRDGTKLVKKA
ncbi:MAG: cysteine--tRNA ligase [Proteobacteria bacterium]|uniref:Cysteine--tRNA ligase n=1 Tax=Candidatus Enterousia excrementavium TaxID=2840789 RepID=A0A940DFV6_9PROT|nr:cysteine--tRNA ligase [Candidatus Enterousia excrementavium]